MKMVVESDKNYMNLWLQIYDDMSMTLICVLNVDTYVVREISLLLMVT